MSSRLLSTPEEIEEQTVAYVDWMKQQKQVTVLTDEKINHPSHYNQGKIEVIDFIEDQQLNFSRGSAIKYIARAGKKPTENEVDDLKKALWYIEREIERIKKEKL